MRLILVFLFAACSGFHPTRPLPTDPLQARAAVVHVQCGDSMSELGGDPIDGEDEPWAHETHGSAVVVSSTLAITAAHVLECPEIPTIHLVLADGMVMWSSIDRISGPVAFLKPWGALDDYGHQSGATFGELGYSVCTATIGYKKCGAVRETRYDGERLREFSFDVPGKPGLSGAGVWSGDQLVGIVQGIAANGDTVASAL